MLNDLCCGEDTKPNASVDKCCDEDKLTDELLCCKHDETVFGSVCCSPDRTASTECCEESEEVDVDMKCCLKTQIFSNN